jgi:DNA-binding transcriptional LysR family regulator
VSQFIEECRREWRRLRVPKSAADEMATELEADLAEAQAEGLTPEELLGSDPRSFAAAWSAERGLRPRPRRVLLFAALALSVALALSGTGLALFGGPSQMVRAASPTTIALREAPPPDPTAVRAVWVSQTPAFVTSSSGDDRTLGYVLLLVGFTGTATLGLFSLWRRSTAL